MLTCIFITLITVLSSQSYSSLNHKSSSSLQNVHFFPSIHFLYNSSSLFSSSISKCMALLSLPNSPCFLVGLLKGIFLVIVSHITRSNASQSSDVQSDEPRLEHRPSPLLVPVPLHFIVESIKEHLIEFKHDHNLARKLESNDNDCAVCLTIMVMEECDEVRGLPNCSHVFHKDCIDAWIDKCKTTCPVCRSDLLPGQGEKFICGGDPWRRERMIYLYGEDSFL